MSISNKLTELNNIKQDIKQAIVDKGVDMTGKTFDQYAGAIQSISGGGVEPPTTDNKFFTGATIPITYKDNVHQYENEYVYESDRTILITGLDGRATIENNASQQVTVKFDVSSDVSSLHNFNITLSTGEEFIGLHAHYGETATGVLTFAFNNIPIDEIGSIGVDYQFIDSPNLPLFYNTGANYNGIGGYQILNILLGNFTGTSVGNYFMQSCSTFNQPITIPSSVTSIGVYFMNYCYAFNQPLTLPNSVTSIVNYFMQNCRVFNQPLTLPNVTSIGENFMSSCYAFNQPLTIPNSVTSIRESFMSSCYAFNQPLTLPNVTSIGSSFMQNCYAFNQPLTLPNVTSIGNYFMQNFYAFNQPLTLPNVTSIGSNFMQNCYAFNQPITIPSSVNSIGGSFMNNARSLSSIIYEAEVFPTDTNSLATSSNFKNTADGYGIKVYGSKRLELMTALPNITNRKLVDGGR